MHKFTDLRVIGLLLCWIEVDIAVGHWTDTTKLGMLVFGALGIALSVLLIQIFLPPWKGTNAGTRFVLGYFVVAGAVALFVSYLVK